MSKYRTRKPDRVGSLNSLADVLPVLCEQLDLENKVNELAFLRLWPSRVTELMGLEAASQTQAVKLRKQGNRLTLLVKVAHAALAAELGFHVLALQTALNQFEPQTGISIHRIQFVVGSIKK
jgi:hypothetical protein